MRTVTTAPCPVWPLVSFAFVVIINNWNPTRTSLWRIFRQIWTAMTVWSPSNLFCSMPWPIFHCRWKSNFWVILICWCLSLFKLRSCHVTSQVTNVMSMSDSRDSSCYSYLTSLRESVLELWLTILMTLDSERQLDRFNSYFNTMFELIQLSVSDGWVRTIWSWTLSSSSTISASLMASSLLLLYVLIFGCDWIGDSTPMVQCLCDSMQYHCGQRRGGSEAL